MKIWLKYILACIIGILATFVLPLDNEKIFAFFNFLFDVSINIGRYMLVPTLFFSMAIGVYKLRDTKCLMKTAIACILITIPTSIILSILGVISVSIIKFPRIPISVEEITQFTNLNIPANLLKIFPDSPFKIFIDGNYLFPLFVLAGFIGAALASDKSAGKFSVNVFDSLSRVFYSILSFFVDIFTFCLIIISTFWTFKYHAVLLSGTYNFLFLILSISMLVIILGIYPFVLCFVFKEYKPYRVLYASIATLLTAFFTSDNNITLGISLRHAKESLGIQRRIGSVCLPIFSIFARGGTALTVAISFIVILKSYSRQSLSINDMLWIIGLSSGMSFFLGSFPIGGPFIALTVLCTLYGHGFESGYLILKPISFFIGSIAATIDAATAIFGTYLIASKEKNMQRRDLKFFI